MRSQYHYARTLDAKPTALFPGTQILVCRLAAQADHFSDLMLANCHRIIVWCPAKAQQRPRQASGTGGKHHFFNVLACLTKAGTQEVHELNCDPWMVVYQGKNIETADR